MKTKLLFSIVTILLLQFSINAYAVFYSSINSGNWNNPAIWNPAGVPGVNDIAFISSGHTVTLTQTEIVKSLACDGFLHFSNNSSHTFTILESELGAGSFIGNENAVLILNAGTTFSGNDIKFTAGNEKLHTLRVNLTGAGNNFLLGSDLQIYSELIFESGVINAQSHTLTLGSSLASPGTLTYTNAETNTHFIKGKFKRFIPASTDVLFPVGVGTHYRPVTVNATSSFSDANITAEALASATSNNTSNIDDAGYTIDRYSNEAYWVFSQGGTFGTKTVSVGAYGISGVSGANFSELRYLYRQDGSQPWGVHGTHVAATGSSSTYPLVKRTGVPVLWQVSIGGNAGQGNTLSDLPLPVSLTSFTKLVTGRNVKLNWVTEKEINNKGFEVERAVISNQLSEYTNIGYVEGNGTKNTPTSYAFEDKNLNTGKYKYRLKQLDNNGNYEYHELSGIIEVGVPKKYDMSQNYPNPFNPVTKINFDIPESGLVNIRLYDMLGREVAVLVNEERNAGFYTVQFDASKLSSGIYFYRMSAGNFSGIKKMSVIK